MGLIHCMELNFSQIPEISNGIVKKDSFFDEVPTLKQKNLEKWAESKFEFKIKIEHEWYRCLSSKLSPKLNLFFCSNFL